MKPTLYIKSGCPWCDAALAHFQHHGIELDIRDVLSDPAAFRRLRQISNQTRCPTLEYLDFVVADFSIPEFELALSHAPAPIREKFMKH